MEIGDGAGYDEVRHELVRQHISDGRIPFISNHISGWLHEKLTEKIAAGQLATITWEEFNNQIRVLFERSRRRELIDFTSERGPDARDVEQQRERNPCYLSQLDVIGCNDDELIEAVCEYLRAMVNRSKWIEDDLIDEETASDFDLRLRSFWRNRQRSIELTQTGLGAQKKGQLLLANCRNRQETIRDMTPPSSTIAGTYHALADKPVLGWHPNWKDLFKKRGEA